MRRSELLVASLPPEMMREVERLKKVEHRTRSELVREALRNYFALRAKFTEEEPTVGDLRAINEGRRQHAEGETIPLKKALRELHSRTDKARNKTARGNHAR
jgi:metal-responsive CopG/Arc/MetJ family transcriptional regulator